MRILDHTAGFLFAPLWSIGAQIELLEKDPFEQQSFVVPGDLPVGQKLLQTEFSWSCRF
jgi:hypothetical protein